MIGLIDRRSFVAGLGALGLTGCAKKDRKPIRILSGSGPGSASTLLVALFARHLGRFGIDASIETLPRSGGKLAARRLLDSPADGSIMAMLPTGLLYAQLRGEEDTPWDLAKFAWVGNFSSDRRILIASEASGIRRFADLIGRPKPMLIATNTSTSPGYYEALIVRDLTGANLQPVPGFAGDARNLALTSGEVDGLVASLDGLGQVMALPGIRILLRLNDLPLPPQTPGEPQIAPLLKDVASGPDAPALLDLIDVHARLGRIVALPPETPAEIVAEWRTLFAQLLADRAFRKDAAAAGFVLSDMPGEAVNALLADLLHRRRRLIEPALSRVVARSRNG